MRAIYCYCQFFFFFVGVADTSTGFFGYFYRIRWDAYTKSSINQRKVGETIYFLYIYVRTADSVQCFFITMGCLTCTVRQSTIEPSQMEVRRTKNIVF